MTWLAGWLDQHVWDAVLAVVWMIVGVSVREVWHRTPRYLEERRHRSVRYCARAHRRYLRRYPRIR